MTAHENTPRVLLVPATIGLCLWAAATALLLEEAYHAHRFDVATLSVPILTLATVAAACLAHQRFASWRLIGGCGFALLALLGSTVMATGTLGRLAEAKDGKEANTQAVNRGYGYKADELKAAKVEQAKECKTIGKRCTQWQARVDTLTKELAGIVVRSTDPKADAVVKLAELFKQDGDHVRAIVTALDPVALPLFLEFGSVLFFASAFPHRRKVRVIVAASAPETLNVSAAKVEAFQRTWSRDEILSDLKRMKQVGAQRFLATRYGISEGQISKLMKEFELAGHITRHRDGQRKQIQRLS